MPAAAVIPAPIAYANAVAVKKLVVGFRARGCIRPTEARRSTHVVWCPVSEVWTKPYAFDHGSSHTEPIC